MSALTLDAEIAADLRDRERRFALGYTDHGLTRAQIASYYRRQAREWRKMGERYLAAAEPLYGFDADPETQASRCERSARLCDRRAKEYER